MMFIELNDGTTQNIMTISRIYIQETDLVYETAKGSLNEIREHFDTIEEAQARYEDLQNKLLLV